MLDYALATMRLKSDVFVQAYMRIAAAGGAAAMLVRRGDADAGAIFIRINRLDGTADLYGPAPAGLDVDELGRQFVRCFAAGGVTDQLVDDYLGRQRAVDPDLWVVEVEDRAGRNFLDDWLVRE